MAITLKDPQDGEMTEVSDINITPFIDVLLVLLTIGGYAALDSECRGRSAGLQRAAEAAAGQAGVPDREAGSHPRPRQRGRAAQRAAGDTRPADRQRSRAAHLPARREAARSADDRAADSRAQRSNTAAAPFASTAQAPSVSPASWRGALNAHLNRYKRFPGGAGSGGVVQIAFTIDRAGRVLSSRLLRSSGNPALDQEAVSLPRRASPVPAPSANVGGNPLTLAVPIRFNR